MGFWNRAGRWLAWAAGLLFMIVGFNALWHGLDIIQVERGWTGVIAGTTAMSAGALMILITFLIDRVDALRLAVLTQRALQVAEASPVPQIAPEAPQTTDAAETPKPLEIPVEPPAIPPVASQPAFNFRTFGKRPARAQEPTVEAAEAVPAPVIEAQATPEPIRRFAPPQFRRPSFAPPRGDEASPQSVTEPAPAPESEGEPKPVPVEIEMSHAEILVEASITEAIVEELRLPRASSLTPEEAAEQDRAEAEPTGQEPETPAQASEAAREPIPQRGPAQTHEWLEKSLSGEDSEPALDWLRQRRGSEERPVPSFMRRHVASEPEETAEADEPPSAEPAPESEAAAAAAGPSILGRYSANGSDYTLYADGSIDAQTPTGPRHFASMEELRGFLQRQNAPTEG